MYSRMASQGSAVRPRRIAQLIFEDLEAGGRNRSGRDKAGPPLRHRWPPAPRPGRQNPSGATFSWRTSREMARDSRRRPTPASCWAWTACPMVAPRPGQMRAFIQVLAFLDHAGGEGQAGRLAAIAAIGAGQIFQYLHYGNRHEVQPRFANFSSSRRPRLARCAFSSPARVYKTSLVWGWSLCPQT